MEAFIMDHEKFRPQSTIQQFRMRDSWSIPLILLQMIWHCQLAHTKPLYVVISILPSQINSQFHSKLQCLNSMGLKTLAIGLSKLNVDCQLFRSQRFQRVSKEKLVSITSSGNLMAQMLNLVKCIPNIQSLTNSLHSSLMRGITWRVNLVK